jgi:hypothetical protein
MLLGTLLARLETPAYATALLEGSGDLVLLARIEATSAAHDERPGEYAANAVARFSQGASDEDWLALMTALERAQEPAATCLRHMVLWSLEGDATPHPQEKAGCSCGGQGGCHDHA